jgi:hypothetical protein
MSIVYLTLSEVNREAKVGFDDIVKALINPLDKEILADLDESEE